MDLLEIREELDKLDGELAALFVRRMELSAAVAKEKERLGKPVFDPAREEEKLEQVRGLCGEKFGGYACELFEKIMSISRSYQKSLLGRFGLLGQKLSHSYSPQIHKIFGGYDYELFEREPEDVAKFLEKREFDGINVTIPYKKTVIPLCDEISENARRIGSVNTIVKKPDGTLRGDNTDYYGFRELVRHAQIEPKGRKCLILGDGGVAPTIRAVLTDLGAAEIITVSRRGEQNFDNLSRHYDSQIIVNATPVGMYPANGQNLVDITNFNNLCGVLDVIYNPDKTQLILDAEAAGIPCAGGLYMLVAQARRGCELFVDKKIPQAQNDAVFRCVAADMKNIALIGMPGCGKTSAGRELKKLTGRRLVDMDEEIVSRVGCSIPEYFAAHGEEDFRRVETEVLSDFSKRSGLIIATGGGVVTRPENYNLLRQNSVVVFLHRKDLLSLDKSGRPVSQSRRIEDIYNERLPMYKGWSDFTVECENPASNARRIMEELLK